MKPETESDRRQRELDRSAQAELLRPYLGEQDQAVRDAVRRDAERAEQVEELAQFCPHLKPALGLLNWSVPIVPLHPMAWTAKSRPLATIDAAIEWWSQQSHWADAAGFVLGPHAAITTAAIVCDRWEFWSAWLHTFDDRVEIPRGDTFQGDFRMEPRPSGTPSRLSWWPPQRSGLVRSGGSFRGPIGGPGWNRLARQAWPDNDHGGALCWAVLPDEAAGLPSFRARELAPGLRLLGDGEIMVWSATRPDGWWLQLISGGYPWNLAWNDSDRPMSPWLVRELRAPLVQRAVARARRAGRAIKEIAAAAAPRSDVLDTVR